MAARSGPWIELGDRVFTRRYEALDQQIGLILGAGEALLVDTRSSHRQAREILEDLRELTTDSVGIVVDTHWHADHTFGNHVFRPATIWGHERCGPRLLEFGERNRAAVAEAVPEFASEVAEVVIDPPDRSFSETATIEVGGRRVELRYLGRGHTDADIVIVVPDAAVVFAGDLLEAGATPYFGDGYRSIGRRRPRGCSSSCAGRSCPDTARSVTPPSPRSSSRPSSRSLDWAARSTPIE